MAFPTLKRVLSSLEKIKAEVIPTATGYKAIKGNNIVLIYHQEGAKERVVCIMCSPSVNTNMMVDYSEDVYHHTIKEVVAALNA
jgi:hypothetical protein